LRTHLNEGVVAILAASLLFLLPVNWSERRFTFTWNEAVRIDWDTILLFGAGITLSKPLSDTGLARTIGDGGTNALGVTSPLGITLLATVVAILIS
jgi:sodium-dependent dicarboxylate transporter 2/3/5